MRTSYIKYTVKVVDKRFVAIQRLHNENALLRSGPPSPANMRDGSFTFSLKGYNPEVKGNSPGTFSCRHHLKISPQACI
jgi:hypothetical protein